MVSGLVIVNWPVVNTIVSGVANTPESKLISSVSGNAFAIVTASRSEPGPLSLVLVTSSEANRRLSYNNSRRSNFRLTGMRRCFTQRENFCADFLVEAYERILDISNILELSL